MGIPGTALFVLREGVAEAMEEAGEGMKPALDVRCN